MGYGKVQRDGTIVPTGHIVGYRVVYDFNGFTRLMSFRDRSNRLKTIFPNFARANSSVRRARWGTNPRIVPVYMDAKGRRQC